MLCLISHLFLALSWFWQLHQIESINTSILLQDPDLVVETMSSGSSSQPARSSSSSARTQPTNDQPRSRSTGGGSFSLPLYNFRSTKDVNFAWIINLNVLVIVESKLVSIGSTARTSGTSPASVPPNSLRWDRQTIQFSVNAWVYI